MQFNPVDLLRFVTNPSLEGINFLAKLITQPSVKENETPNKSQNLIDFKTIEKNKINKRKSRSRIKNTQLDKLLARTGGHSFIKTQLLKEVPKLYYEYYAPTVNDSVVSTSKLLFTIPQGSNYTERIGNNIFINKICIRLFAYPLSPSQVDGTKFRLLIVYDR